MTTYSYLVWLIPRAVVFANRKMKLYIIFSVNVYSHSHCIEISILTKQSALVGFLKFNNYESWLLLNHILLIFKMYIYKSRERGVLNFTRLKGEIEAVIKTEIQTEKLFRSNSNYSSKWNLIRPLLES